MNWRNLFCLLMVGCLPCSVSWSQEKKEVPAGTPVTIVVKPAEIASPSITLKLNGRQAKAVPQRCGFSHTGGGNIDVQQPSPDTIVLTVTGVAVAGCLPCTASNAAMHIELSQCFEVVFEKKELKNPKLTVEGRVIGVLRTKCKGDQCASESAHASICPAHGGDVLTLTLPANSACNGDNVSINDHEGPDCAPVLCGKYFLHAQFEVSASHTKGLCKAASAEFAPDALDPLWIDVKEPFKGIAKKDFGFQVTIKVMEDAGTSNGNGDSKEEVKESEKPAQKPETEKPPAPKK